LSPAVRWRRGFRGVPGWRNRAIVTALLLLVLVCARLFAPSSRAPNFTFESAGPFLVERVVDGDTLLLEGGTRVRLIGVDTPESVKPDSPVEPLGREAAEFTRSRVERQRVTLQYDRERRDQYQRVLAYVYVGEAMLNEELIRAGFSRAETRFPYDQGMKNRFRKAEQEAREARRGLWASGG